MFVKKEILAVESVHVGSQKHDGLHLQSQGKFSVMDKNVLNTFNSGLCVYLK